MLETPPKPTNETEQIPRKLRIAFFASHNGTDMKAVVEAIRSSSLYAEPVMVISNNSTAPALEYARENGIKALHISKTSGERRKTDEEVDEEIAEVLQAHNIDVGVFCGYMKHAGPRTLKTPCLNVHPSLLPDFAGYWGDSIYDAIFTRRKTHPENPEYTWTGPTVHWVDDLYDHGDHVRQAAIKIEDGETEDHLRKRTQLQEATLLIQTLQDISRGFLPLPERKTTALRR